MMLIQSTPYAIKLSPLSLAGGVLSGVEGERVGERVEAQRLGGYSELSTPSLALPLLGGGDFFFIIMGLIEAHPPTFT